MELITYHVDAFTDRLFGGNPAIVCILPTWLPEKILQNIATENHLPATAFLVRENNKYFTRWFTPEYEIDLCGHGTLASGHIIFNKLDPLLKEIELHSPAGLLKIKRNGDLFTLDFPSKKIETCQPFDLLEQGLGDRPKEIYQHKTERCLAVFESEEIIRQIKPDMSILKNLPFRGVVVTARGDKVDFVSRVFYPKKLLSEDAVTGSSHCLLVPYWADKLNKATFHARQISHRGGDLFCSLEKDRVLIEGRAVLYQEGKIII